MPNQNSKSASDKSLNENERKLAGLLLQSLALQTCATGLPPELEFTPEQRKALQGTYFDGNMIGKSWVSDHLIKYGLAEYTRLNSPLDDQVSPFLAVMLLDASDIPKSFISKNDLKQSDLESILRCYDLNDDDVFNESFYPEYEMFPELNQKISKACVKAGYPDVRAEGWSAD